MEEGKISDERSPIMGEITTTTVTVKIDDYSSSSTKPLDFARILKSLLVFSTLGIAFLVLYYSSSDKNGQFVPSLGRLYSSFYGDDNYAVVKDEYYELRKVLEAASTKEKTVILTTLNDAWAEPNSIFDLFLKSFRNGNNTAYLLNHLVVVAVDEKAYFRCHKLGQLHCYYLKTNESSTMAHEARFMTPIYLDMMWGRLAFLRTILSLGYNFVFTDTDVMWFRDPLPHFTLDSDFQTSCDHFNGNEFNISNAPNNGFVFVRSNNRTIKFYDFWVSSRHTYPRLHEQDVFNKIKSGDFVRQLGVKLRFMDTTYFGGFCERSRDFNKVCTMHANCCIGLDNKIADLKTILKVWKNYLSNNHTTRQPANWRVPHKCHM